MAVDYGVLMQAKNFAQGQDQQRKDAIGMQKMLYDVLRQKTEVDADKLGEQAFLKAAQGMPLNGQEAAALKFIDAKQQTMGYNPVTGAEIQKPSLLQRAGLNFDQPQQLPQQMPTMQPKSATPHMSKVNVDNMARLFNASPIDAPTETNVMPEPQGLPEIDQELMKYKNNPKMQQSIRETYTKNQINANSPENKFKFENSLRDEFTTTTKDFRNVQDAYSKIKKTTSTGAGDMSMLYQFVKLLDPGSVVRESEFATAAASGSLGERIQGAYKSISQGGRMPESLRNEFIAEAENIYNGQKEGYDRSIETYKGLAQRNNLNADNIVTDYRQLNPVPQPRVKAEADFNARKVASPEEIAAFKKKYGIQ